MQLTMIKKGHPLSSHHEYWNGKWRIKLIKDTDNINEVFHQMYEHKHEAEYFIITFGFANTTKVTPEELI